MRFTSILKRIISEQSKAQVLYDKLVEPKVDKDNKKMKPLLTPKEFLSLVQGDPKSNLEGVTPETFKPEDLAKIKAGGYVPWLVKMYLGVKPDMDENHPRFQEQLKAAKNLFLEDLYKVTEDLAKFDRFKTRLPEELRNITNIKSTQQLYELVKDFSAKKKRTSAEEKKKAAETFEHPGAEVVFRGSNWTVVKIEDKGDLGKSAAVYYGGSMKGTGVGETRWCTSSPGLDWFNRYIKTGPLWVILPNNWDGKRGEISGLPAGRYQFHFPEAQFMDADDHQIDLASHFNGDMEELKPFFKPMFAKSFITQGREGTRFKIDSFRSGSMGKYISIYGINDVLEGLPDNVDVIEIINNDAQGMILDLPDLSRFKKLETLILQNCIKDLPESVCGCESLMFLTLNNNSQLNKIPDCAWNLPKLLLVNLSNTKATIPKSVEEDLKSKGKTEDDYTLLPQVYNLRDDES